jgi:hypothetical protein
MTRPKPTVTGTNHALPFDKLSPRDFWISYPPPMLKN